MTSDAFIEALFHRRDLRTRITRLRSALDMLIGEPGLDQARAAIQHAIHVVSEEQRRHEDLVDSMAHEQKES